MNSSYKQSTLDYSDIFKLLIYMVNPKKVVEFGILDGYSLKIFADNCDNDCKIEGYDIFEEFNGNGSNMDTLNKNFEKYENIVIQYGDYYKIVENFDDNSIDILHIDIANNGDVYKFAIEQYMKKVKKNGIIILEGGSKDRDNVEWMIKYNKPKFCDYLDTLNNKYHIIDKFPSITVFKNV